MHASLFPTWDPELAQRLKERFEISGAKKVRDMSKGEARRVAVACAIAHRPQLLLLDEPSSGFDLAARREFLETALERLASRIAFLHGSRMVLDEPSIEFQEEFSLVLGEGGADEVLGLRTLRSCVTARSGCFTASSVAARSVGPVLVLEHFSWQLGILGSAWLGDSPIHEGSFHA